MFPLNLTAKMSSALLEPIKQKSKDHFVKSHSVTEVRSRLILHILYNIV